MLHHEERVARAFAITGCAACSCGNTLRMQLPLPSKGLSVRDLTVPKIVHLHFARDSALRQRQWCLGDGGNAEHRRRDE